MTLWIASGAGFLGEVYDAIYIGVAHKAHQSLRPVLKYSRYAPAPVV